MQRLQAAAPKVNKDEQSITEQNIFLHDRSVDPGHGPDPEYESQSRRISDHLSSLLFFADLSSQLWKCDPCLILHFRSDRNIASSAWRKALIPSAKKQQPFRAYHGSASDSSEHRIYQVYEHLLCDAPRSACRIRQCRTVFSAAGGPGCRHRVYGHRRLFVTFHAACP